MYASTPVRGPNLERNEVESLYSPIQARDSQEEGLVKERYWKSRIEDYLLQRGIFNFELSTLKEEFKFDDLIPDSLEQVVVERCSNDFVKESKLLRRMDDGSSVFKSPLKLSNWVSLAASFAGMSLNSSSSTSDQERFVYTPLLQKVSDLIRVHSKQKSALERTFVIEKIATFSYSFSEHFEE